MLFFFFLKIYLFDWLIAMLGLRFCARAFSRCGKRGPLFIAVRGPLTIVASPAAEHRLQTRRLSSCGSRAQLLRGMWDLPRPGLEPVSPAPAGRFPTTAPPGKPCGQCFYLWIKYLPNPSQKGFSYAFFYNSYSFRFNRFLSYLTIFVFGERYRSKFISFAYRNPTVQVSFIERLFFPHWIVFGPLSKINWPHRY